MGYQSGAREGRSEESILERMDWESINFMRLRRK